MAAYGLHVSRLRHVQALIMLLLTPIVVPVILIGIGVFYAYVKLKLVNTLVGLVLAHSMLAIPVVMRVVGSALKTYDMDQERVARNMFNALRDQIDPTIAAISTLIIGVTTLLLVFTQYFGKPAHDT